MFFLFDNKGEAFREQGVPRVRQGYFGGRRWLEKPALGRINLLASLIKYHRIINDLIISKFIPIIYSTIAINSFVFIVISGPFAIMNNNSANKNRSLSLPKIGSIPQPKPLKEFHRVNWSIAPNCLVEGHQTQPVIYVCVNPICSHTTRLVCELCFYREHREHNNQFLAIDQIKQGNVGSLRFWPFDAQFRPIYEFIRQHNAYVQNMIRDIKSTFENFLHSAVIAIKEVQDNYLNKVDQFYEKNSRKQTYINQLTAQVEDGFQIKQIQNEVRRIFAKEIRHDIFMKNMKKILNSSQVEQKRRKIKEEFEAPTTDRGKDMEFNKIYFLKKQKIILRDIKEQENALKEKTVEIDEAAAGLELIITQTIDYLTKSASGMHPLTFEAKNMDDGTFYQGFLYKNNKSLLGMRDYKNGFIYYGEWRNNCRSGWGVYENKSTGYKYAGNWKEDKKNGFGKQRTPLYQFEGNFKDDKKDGFGVIRQDEVRFDITWKMDKKHGKGKRYDAEGQTQVYFLNGVQSLGKAGGENDKRDINFLAKMFAQKQTV